MVASDISKETKYLAHFGKSGTVTGGMNSSYTGAPTLLQKLEDSNSNTFSRKIKFELNN